MLYVVVLKANGETAHNNPYINQLLDTKASNRGFKAVVFKIFEANDPFLFQGLRSVFNKFQDFLVQAFKIVVDS